ncbi:hypothetical protein BZA05DRAFT_442849 [Tricharina praecox]|uniref:uncharacterized protein n=1 Tax=Tricharina praecox TaxID=43433 RepID=UPI0022210337|nr:uncharacterized protein BZA05DRAFT_442849 [Tricharina praecox]KAI5855188.1 hypothetical protein BZA05DRAFT_442849 [Tricharina praecox]
MSSNFTILSDKGRLYAIVCGILVAYVVIYTVYLVWCFQRFNARAELQEAEEEEHRMYVEREGRTMFEAMMKELEEAEARKREMFADFDSGDEAEWSTDSEVGYKDE